MIVVGITSCNIPQDPEHSFDNAKRHGLKVGVVENLPLVQEQNGQLSGVEIHLIESFANRHNLHIDYTIGTESQLIKKLEKYDLHLIAGGFDKETIWISRAGLSTSYDQKHVLLVPKGENKLLFKLEQHILEVY